MEWNRWIELIVVSLIVIGTGIYPKATTHGEFHVSFGGETVSKTPAEIRPTASFVQGASTVI